MKTSIVNTEPYIEILLLDYKYSAGPQTVRQLDDILLKRFLQLNYNLVFTANGLLSVYCYSKNIYKYGLKWNSILT